MNSAIKRHVARKTELKQEWLFSVLGLVVIFSDRIRKLIDSKRTYLLFATGTLIAAGLHFVQNTVDVVPLPNRYHVIGNLSRK